MFQLEKIKRILEREGGKCIVIDESRDEYLVIEKRSFKEEEKEDEIEKVNRDIEEMKVSEEPELETEFGDEPEEKKEELRIEDLPF